MSGPAPTTAASGKERLLSAWSQIKIEAERPVETDLERGKEGSRAAAR